LCGRHKARRPCARSSVVGDMPQLFELAKCLLVDHVCVSSLEVVAPTPLLDPSVFIQNHEIILFYKVVKSESALVKNVIAQKLSTVVKIRRKVSLRKLGV